MKKWNRSLGTSKREQGITTPKAIRGMSKRMAKAKKQARLLGKLKDFMKKLFK